MLRRSLICKKPLRRKLRLLPSTMMMHSRRRQVELVLEARLASSHQRRPPPKSEHLDSIKIAYRSADNALPPLIINIFKTKYSLLMHKKVQFGID